MYQASLMQRDRELQLGLEVPWDADEKLRGRLCDWAEGLQLKRRPQIRVARLRSGVLLCNVQGTRSGRRGAESYLIGAMQCADDADFDWEWRTRYVSVGLGVPLKLAKRVKLWAIRKFRGRGMVLTADKLGYRLQVATRGAAPGMDAYIGVDDDLEKVWKRHLALERLR